MSTNTAEIIDFAAYRGRRAQTEAAIDPLALQGFGQAGMGLMMMPVPVFFVWPMPWFAIPIVDNA